uniref:Uncharacterized protein n=1 Tax=Tetranychus urticae TaxID=32264 RepID=T1L2M7_TETUR
MLYTFPAFKLFNHQLQVTGHSNTNRIIRASLTDKDTGRVWQMQEWVYSGSPRAGRIEIKTDENGVNVFYSYKNSMDNKKRLVIHGVLLGPSVLDRFDGFDWANGNDEIIRGLSMHSVSTDLDGKLNITLYYKDNLNQMNGIQQPSQIVFTGHNPDTLVEGEAETLILDIYLQSQTEQELDKLVQVTPGFGCPVYLNGNVAFPELNTVKIHFIAAEIDDYGAKVTSINEYHADESYQVLRQAQLSKFGDEKLIDYSLGAFYRIHNYGACYTKSIESNEPGIDEKGSFSIARLLWLPKI